MDSNKKISFGFSKLSKKPAVIRTQPIEEKQVELVDCLEGQSIKIKNAVEVVNEPLIIPIKDNKNNLLDRVKEAKIKQKESIKAEVKQEDDKADSNLTLDELAVKALINDAKNSLERTTSNGKVMVLPVKEDKLTVEGEEEPTLDDYESIPISDYGMAMLRGMGWKEGIGIGKNSAKPVITSTPELRPKGLGLGATKIIKPEASACDKEGNELILKRGSFAKIIAGSHKGSYCEVQGLDDEAGRVIVKTSLKNEVLTLNEFLLVTVTKEEYLKRSKVLNNAKYEEYKEISDRKLESYRKTSTKSKDKYSESDGDSEGPSDSRRLKNKSSSHKTEYPQKKDKHSESDDDSEGPSSSRRLKNKSSFHTPEYPQKKDKYSETEGDFEGPSNSRRLKNKSSSHKTEYPNRRYSSDFDRNVSSESKSESDTTHKSKNKTSSKRDKYKDDYERRRSKSKRRESSSDSGDKYNKSKGKRKASSDSDFTHERNKRKSKRERHRDRSRSRDKKQKSSKKSKNKNRDRSPSDYRRSTSSKKSKSRHRRRSSSSS